MSRDTSSSSVSPSSSSGSGLGAYRSGRFVHYNRRFLSPLMMRIMAVNVFALLTLVGGVLYLSDYRAQLIEARIQELTVQARTIASALGESQAVQPDSDVLDPAPARQILSRLVAPTDYRARLFTSGGQLAVDSLFLAGEKRVIEEKLEATPRTDDVLERLEMAIYGLFDGFSKPLIAPPDIERIGIRAADLIEVENALLGEEMRQVRVRSDGEYVINVAVPVQRFRRVLGGLLLSAQTTDIEEIVRSTQRQIVRVFLGALAITLLMAFFLGSTLVRPIRILAGAAERVRRGIGREESLPEFGDRRDEIGDLSRSLSAMTRALYNQIDAVERFAADVAHELKNPITSMHSAIETLENTSKPEVQQKLMTILKEDVKRLERLVTDISDASRLDAELTRGDMEVVDIGMLLKMIVEGYQALELPHAVTFKFEPPEPGVFIVSGIEQRLSQVWRNLIDNAISFSPAGGMIEIAIHRQSHMVSVVVQDEGPGLADGAVAKIFKRFYSDRPEGEAFGNHSGLGLAISSQVVEAHGGRIIAGNRKPEKGQAASVSGARFEVFLPHYKN